MEIKQNLPAQPNEIQGEIISTPAPTPESTPPAPAANNNPPAPEVGTKEDVVPKAEFEKIEEKNKRLYARLQKAGVKVDEQGNDIPETPTIKPAPNNQPSSVDEYSLAKSVKVLKDYDEEEIEHAQFLSKSTNLPASEVIKTKEFQFYIQGRRGELKRDGALPNPSGSTPSPKLPAFSEIAKMTPEDHKKLVLEDIERQRRGGASI